MPGFENIALSLTGGLVSGFDRHYPKTIRMEDEPYITQHSYWKHVVGMTDFEATLLVWSANGQPLSPADKNSLAAAIEKVKAKGVLPSFDSYSADPNRHTMAAAVAHRSIFDPDASARSGITDVRGGVPVQARDIPSGLDKPLEAAAFGGVPMKFLLLAGLGVGLVLAVKSGN